MLDQVLSSRETTWLQHLKAATDAGKVSGSSFLAAVRRRMESIVLALPRGSNAQRIQVGCLIGEPETLGIKSEQELGVFIGCPAVRHPADSGRLLLLRG